MLDTMEQWEALSTPATMRRVVPTQEKKEERLEILPTPAVPNVRVIPLEPTPLAVLGKSSTPAMRMLHVEPLGQDTSLLASSRPIW